MAFQFHNANEFSFFFSLVFHTICDLINRVLIDVSNYTKLPTDDAMYHLLLIAINLDAHLLRMFAIRM